MMGESREGGGSLDDWQEGNRRCGLETRGD